MGIGRSERADHLSQCAFAVRGWANTRMNVSNAIMRAMSSMISPLRGGMEAGPAREQATVVTVASFMAIQLPCIMYLIQDQSGTLTKPPANDAA